MSKALTFATNWNFCLFYNENWELKVARKMQLYLDKQIMMFYKHHQIIIIISLKILMYQHIRYMSSWIDQTII